MDVRGGNACAGLEHRLDDDVLAVRIARRLEEGEPLAGERVSTVWPVRII
jgi:hypothetical protein